jgi:hypothetical protein
VNDGIDDRSDPVSDADSAAADRGPEPFADLSIAEVDDRLVAGDDDRHVRPAGRADLAYERVRRLTGLRVEGVGHARADRRVRQRGVGDLGSAARSAAASADTDADTAAATAAHRRGVRLRWSPGDPIDVRRL